MGPLSSYLFWARAAQSAVERACSNRQPAAPQAAVPQAAVPQAAVPQAAVPQAAEPRAAVPQVVVPQAAVPQVAASLPAVPQAAVPCSFSWCWAHAVKNAVARACSIIYLAVPRSRRLDGLLTNFFTHFPAEGSAERSAACTLITTRKPPRPAHREKGREKR
eukprot:1142574-Pelagomonas_calceolata.AAC.3